ncbi:MAG TPA: tail fiber protein [Flavisolibacter sp.]|jgi:microcystin-dependent protein|nr:tail fiber protein [Flavisolibacter sp.]
MAQPYIGEIRLFAGNFPPIGWLFCEGQMLPISENDILFILIGTTYGGDGQETFALPDLRGRVPVHQGNGFILAETGGAEEVTLTVNQIPNHSHPLSVSGSAGSTSLAAGKLLAKSTSKAIYKTSGTMGTMSPQAIGGTGGSQPHTNFQPYLCINYIISLYGLFPSQT